MKATAADLPTSEKRSQESASEAVSKIKLKATCTLTPPGRDPGDRICSYIKTRWKEKLQTKKQNFVQLTHMLRKAIWRGADPHALILGMAGTARIVTSTCLH